MTIFNSLGSNYNFPFAFKTVFSRSDRKSKQELISYLSKKYGGEVFLLGKGREAIILGIKSLLLPKNSEIGVTGFTCIAVSRAIAEAGCKPVYLDIRKGGLNFSFEELEKNIKKYPDMKAVIVQNTLGYPSDIVNIKKTCQKHGLILIEDLAHSVGIRYENGIEGGLVGDLVVFSFSQDKMIDGITGGALIVKNKKIMVDKSNLKLKKIGFITTIKNRFYPILTFFVRKLYSVGAGKLLHLLIKRTGLLSDSVSSKNMELYNLDYWYCKLIRTRFSELEKNIIHRRKIARIYEKDINPELTMKRLARNINHSTNLRFPILTNNRNGLILYLKEKGIYVSDIWYDAAVSPKHFLNISGYKKGTCVNSELVSSKIINLPTHINIKERGAKQISKQINQWQNTQ